jgi:ABC-type molybdenum transport system ATPase subunit/photorepair protein PhrA
MLAISRALVRDLKLLLLDEPYEGLAPVVRHDIEKALIEVRKCRYHHHHRRAECRCCTQAGRQGDYPRYR